MADPHNPATAAADADASAYVHGSQQINEQRETFALFLRLAKWGSLLTAAGVLFLTIWFQPGGSFVAGFGAMVVLLVVGYYALRSKKTAH